MKRLSSPLIFSVVLAGLMMVGCGGGGGNVDGGMMGGGLTATFTGDAPNPAVDSISMVAGTATGDTFQVEIRVGDIIDFFGTAFSIRFDPTTAEYQSFDDSMSLLQNMNYAPDIEIRADLDQVDSGLVTIVATLKNPAMGPIQGIDTSLEPTNLLLTLTFRATNPTVGPNHNAFSVDAVRGREILICPAAGMCAPHATPTWNGGTMTAM